MNKFSSPFMAKSPLNQVDTDASASTMYKIGDKIREKDAYPFVDEQVHNFQDLSKIQKDKKSQFVTVTNLDTKKTDIIRPPNDKIEFQKGTR